MNSEKTGKFLRNLRTEKKLSQYQLEEKIHISRTLINKLENGKASITLENLLIFSEFYNVGIEEILAGERKENDNQEVFEKVTYNIIKENSLLKKRTKIFFYAIFCLVFVFLLYFFINFYSSIYVYTVNTDNSQIEVTNGLLIKMRDKIYLRMEPKDVGQSNKIKNIYIFYLKNDDKKILYKSTNLELISINDFCDTQEYFSFKYFNDYIKNLYIGYEDNNGKIVENKLIFERDYVNKSIFAFDKSNKKTPNEATSYYSNNILSEAFTNLKEKTVNVEYDKKEYEVIVLASSIRIKELNDIKVIEYKYDMLTSNYFTKLENDIEKFTYVIPEEQCITSNCEYAKEEYNHFINILSKAVNNQK